MLLTLMSLVDMFGGGPIPPPTPHPSDDNLIVDMGGGISSELLKRKEIEARKKILDQDEEDWVLFIHTFIVTNNLN